MPRIRRNSLYKRLTKKYTRAELIKLKKQFLQFDENGDGTISRDELIRAFSFLEQSCEEEVQCIIDELDMDNDGKINFEEFLKLVEEMS